jgi:putative heme-binding domain-containing protein
VDGTAELLGPPLLRLGDRFSFGEAVREVTEPSRAIRTGFEAETVETNDGEIIQGRILTSDPKSLTLIVPGNRTLTLPRENILRHISSEVSLMPEGLLANLDERSLRDLFAYLGIWERPHGIRWRYRLAALFALGIVLAVTSRCLQKAMR